MGKMKGFMFVLVFGISLVCEAEGQNHILIGIEFALELADYECGGVDYDKAIESCNKAIEFCNFGITESNRFGDVNSAKVYESKLPEAYALRGRAYLKKGEYDSAVSDFEEAIRLNPSLAASLESLLDKSRR
jgi:tetratricopeptide (TPR) repeat protein